MNFITLFSALHHRVLGGGKILAVLMIYAFVFVGQPALAENEDWADIRSQIFGERDVIAAGAELALYAPSSAQDAALVPVSVRLSESIASKAKRLHLIIDRNPAPIAADFVFHDGFRDGPSIGERKIETRIRVDSFSKVRAVLETSDGQLLMAAKFVAGAGGCSSPASKDPDEALAGLGAVKVRINRHAALGSNWREGVVMVRHPNFTGMQQDAKTGEFTPAWFVRSINVKRDGRFLFDVRAGISLSENPKIRFTYSSDSENSQLAVIAFDTKDQQFEGANAPGGS